MGNRPQDNRIAVQGPILAPYADPGSMYVGAPQLPTIQAPGERVMISPAFQDVRDVPIFVGFDFRKRIFAGI